MQVICEVCCNGLANPFRVVDGIDYYECNDCKSLFACREFLQLVETQVATHYTEDYWLSETHAAKERAYGASLQRVAETCLYCRIPIKKFLDIGTGPGYLLDALSFMLPSHQAVFYGVEKYPPPLELRTRSPQYKITQLAALDMKFSAGVCIEVIEHLTPNALATMLIALGSVSEDGAMYLFNSGQPEFVVNEDPGYIDPLIRGHIVCYSLKALQKIFRTCGFTVIPLPGRAWAFLAEYHLRAAYVDPVDELFKRIYAPLPENKQLLCDPERGSLLYNAGMDAARCYLENALVRQRTEWALSLQAELNQQVAQAAEAV